MTIQIVSSGSAPKQVSPEPTTQQVVEPKPLSYKTVERILRRAMDYEGMPDMEDDHTLYGFVTLANGTTVARVEDDTTGVRYHYTVCPRDFTPKNLGPIDE